MTASWCTHRLSQGRGGGPLAATGGLDDGEPWDASDDFDSHATAPESRRQSAVVEHSTVALRATELGPDAAAAADALLQWAAAWWRSGCSGGQLKWRIFTTRGDRIAATRSW